MATDLEPTESIQSSSPKASKKRKRKPKPHTLHTHTLRNPPWAYMHLQQLTPSTLAPSSTTTPTQLDAVTVNLQLTAALTQFLGLHGSAIPFDVLKLAGQEAWIRVSAEDRTALTAALSGWVSRGGEGWWVKGWSSWSAGVMGRDGGRDLFVE